jgi:hypothetical protein
MPDTSGSPEQGGWAPGAPPDLVPGLRWRRVFPGEERQLGELRRWLATLLPDEPPRDDVALVATELATNAVRHSASGRGGWFAVEITWHKTMVQIAVADGGGPSVPHIIDDPAADHGRGLQLVRGLSTRTGSCGGQRGRLVWAHVPWPPSSEGEPRLAGQDPYEAAIRADEAALAARFAGLPAWFGRSTLQWWALGPAGLLTAPTPQELAGALSHIMATEAMRKPVAAEGRQADAPFRQAWAGPHEPHRLRSLHAALRDAAQDVRHGLATPRIQPA